MFYIDKLRICIDWLLKTKKKYQLTMSGSLCCSSYSVIMLSLLVLCNKNTFQPCGKD